MSKQAVLSLSGGMDSSTLLLHLLANGYEVTALSFDYGQKHKVELERAEELVSYINESFDKQIIELELSDRDFVNSKYISKLNKIKHQIIRLDGLSQLLNSNLVEGGKEVPEGHYEQENMKDTVVPNRNKIFSSIIQAVALSIANEKDTECIIAMGIHKGDHEIYPDCRSEFRDADFEAFKLGNWGAEKVTYYTPYLNVNKFEILQDGEKCCNELGLDFNEVYVKTNTSYKPMYINGNWYSDYKSASSVERIEAFIKLGKPDPVEYGNESGPADWDTAKEFVEQLLLEPNKK
jgi:7-cyano-7-deazaguanine synthase